MRTSITAARLVFFAVALLFSAQTRAAEPVKAIDDAEDFLFQGETRPVLIRVHGRVDGKPVETAWNEFMAELFKHLDVNGDGVLSPEEAQHAPGIDQIRSPFQRGGFAPMVGNLDTDKDGKVTLAELSYHYRRNGFAPIQLKYGVTQTNLPLRVQVDLRSDSRPEPAPEAVGLAIFQLLDTDKTGKLTRAKLEVAEPLLLGLDKNEDEIVTTRELVPTSNPDAMEMDKRTADFRTLMRISSKRPENEWMVRRVQERYAPKADKPGETKLSRKDLGLDEKTFAQLDRNGDGVLDADEMIGFLKRAPDLELMVRVSEKEKSVELVTEKERRLADKVQVKDGLKFLDLGLTRLDLTCGNGEPTGAEVAMLTSNQLLAQFRQIDMLNKGAITEEQASKNPLLQQMFKAMDRDGDGKVTEKELTTHLDFLKRLPTRAAASCITLELSSQGRGLFDQLDTNHDRRLSIREMRGAVQLLEQLDRDQKGYLVPADIPQTYRLTCKPGMSQAGPFINRVVRSGASNASAEPERPVRGPLWFRKLDRNSDGDVSRKEWLYGEEIFRKVDTDGDGLISVKEAEAFDALKRLNEK